MGERSSLEYQQDLEGVLLPIVVIDAQSHGIDVLRPMIPAILRSRGSVEPGPSGTWLG